MTVALVLVAALVFGDAPLAEDDVAPSVSIDSPSSGQVVDGTHVDVTVSFVASANDSNQPSGNVVVLSLALDGAGVGSFENAPGTKSGAHTFGVDLSGVANGEHTLVATAYQGDPSAGHSASASVTIVVDRPAPPPPPDTTPPTITARVDPPANEAGWHGTAPLVTFEASDAGSGLASVTAPVRVESEGAGQVVTGTALDNAGNTASVSVTVNVDLTAPLLDVLAPIDGATVIGREIVLSGTASDAVSGVAAVTCNGAAAVRADPAFTCPLTLADGLNSIVVSAVDRAGHASTTTVDVTSTLPPPPPPPLPGAAAPAPTGADVSVTTSVSPTRVAPGDRVTYTIVATNNGPAAATNVVLTSSLGSEAELVSATTTQGSCSGTSTVRCALGSLAPSASATVTLVLLVRAPGQFLGSVGIGAQEADPNIANNVASVTVVVTAPPAGVTQPPAPQQGVFAVARTVSGTVLVNGRPLQEVGRIPIGARVDTRNGKVELRTTTGTGVFSAGEFRLQQQKKRGAIAELRLLANIAKACAGTASTRKLSSSSAPPKKKAVARLWGQSKGARFRTTAKYSSATVRGTVWLVTERCDGSLTTVRSGRVEVRDFVRRRTVFVTAGQSYLAARP